MKPKPKTIKAWAVMNVNRLRHTQMIEGRRYWVYSTRAETQAYCEGNERAVPVEIRILTEKKRKAKR